MSWRCWCGRRAGIWSLSLDRPNPSLSRCRLCLSFACPCFAYPCLRRRISDRRRTICLFVCLCHFLFDPIWNRLFVGPICFGFGCRLVCRVCCPSLHFLFHCREG